jgi:hypothetical protein
MVKIKYNLNTISIYLKYTKNKINLNYNQYIFKLYLIFTYFSIF